MAVPACNFGYLPDPVDSRDRNYSQQLSKQPQVTVVENLDWRSKVPEILWQESLGSCVAHGVLGAFRLRHVFDGIMDPKLGNRLHMYAGIRSYIGTLDWDSGGHNRNAFRWANAVGFMPEDETDNGYDIRKFRELPTPREQRLMHDQRNKLQGQVSYSRVMERGEARKPVLKQAMSAGGIPVVGTATTEAFLNYSSGILQKPKAGTRQTGGHAFYLCGFTEDYVIMANSWDEDWGLGGFGFLSWDWIEWDETRDIWVVEKVPYYSHLEAA